MKQAKADSFGYSDTRLWYGLTIFCGTVLILIPVIGSFWAFTTLMIPTFYICKYTAKRYTKSYVEIWQECADYEASAAKLFDFDVFSLVPNNPLHKTLLVREVRKRLDRGPALVADQREFRRASLVSSK